MKTTIIFYKDWLPLIKSLPVDLRAEFWELWSNYDGLSYSPIIQNEHLKGVFDFVISQVKKADTKWNEVQKKRAQAGKKSGDKRRRAKGTSVSKGEQKEQVLTHVQSVEQNELNVNVNVNGNGKVNDDVNDNSFEIFWTTYDKKVDRKETERKWAKLTQADKEAIMKFIPEYKKFTPDKQYRKNPDSFIFNRTWEDELIHTSKNGHEEKTTVIPKGW